MPDSCILKFHESGAPNTYTIRTACILRKRANPKPSAENREQRFLGKKEKKTLCGTELKHRRIIKRPLFNWCGKMYVLLTIRFIGFRDFNLESTLIRPDGFFFFLIIVVIHSAFT